MPQMRRDRSENLVWSFHVDIYVGLKEGYDGTQHSIAALEQELQEICNNGLCVCVIPCKYIYKNGNDSGAIIRLINYPRLPSTKQKIKTKAISIAKRIQDKFSQYRISIHAPDMTYMIGTEE
jgi:hypothetical protein